MMERLFTALEVAVLGLWAGAMAGFAFLFAPVAITIVPRMDTFATLIAAFIRALGPFGMACGALAAGSAALRAARSPEARPLAFARIAFVVGALGASAYETRVVIPAMEAGAAQIPGPIDSVSKDDPRRAAYDAEHRTSTRVYGAAFLCVVIALGLAPFGRRNGRTQGA